MHGSGALIRWLLDNDLVDEMNLLIVPVVLGQGTRLFPDAGPDIALDLVDSRADSKGVTIQVYRPTGRPRYAPHRRPRQRMTPVVGRLQDEVDTHIAFTKFVVHYLRPASDGAVLG